VENQALQEILSKISKAGEYVGLKKRSLSSLTDSGLDLAKMTISSSRKSNFDSMNNIVANLLLNTTW
jgi:phage-related minor tail protein